MNKSNNQSILKSKYKQEVVCIANSILQGKTGIIPGCKKLAQLRFDVSSEEYDDDFSVFVAIDSDADQFVFGEAREHWNPTSLDSIDKKQRKTEDYYREKVFEACRKLIERFN